jgi:putative FmdB family regulatory protein
MPDYRYHCEKCGEDFSLVMTLKEREERKAKCPSCKSKKVTRKLEPFFAKTSRKS